MTDDGLTRRIINVKIDGTIRQGTISRTDGSMSQTTEHQGAGKIVITMVEMVVDVAMVEKVKPVEVKTEIVAAVEGKAGVTRVAIGAKVGEITILIATLQRDGKSEMSTTMNKLW